MTIDDLPAPCRLDELAHCSSYAPGHQVHAIHAKHVGRTPWGWRDGVVADVDGRWTGVRYLADDHRVALWHHHELSAELRIGDPVRVHEQYSVLGSPLGWLSVVLREGLGAVPVPRDVAAWAHRTTAGVADLGSGRALALDWEGVQER